MTTVGSRGLAADEEQLRRRVCGEFREMPGLRLTLAQASRLWNTDRETSARVLEALVDSSFLTLQGDLYQRAGLG